jgi:hypothetical protein
VITNRTHREVPGTAFLQQYLTGGEPTLRLIGAELHNNLAAYAVGPSDDAHDGVHIAGSARLAATAIRAATGEPINIDEVDTYALVAGQCADHRSQRSCSAARAADDFANIVWIHSHLEHPPATEILFLDRDIVGVRDDRPDQMFECVGEHLGLAGVRVSNTCLSSLLGFGWSALDGGRVGPSAFGL